jgi:hypothetical protein
VSLHSHATPNTSGSRPLHSATVLLSFDMRGSRHTVQGQNTSAAPSENAPPESRVKGAVPSGARIRSHLSITALFCSGSLLICDSMARTAKKQHGRSVHGLTLLGVHTWLSYSDNDPLHTFRFSEPQAMWSVEKAGCIAYTHAADARRSLRNDSREDAGDPVRLLASRAGAGSVGVTLMTVTPPSTAHLPADTPHRVGVPGYRSGVREGERCPIASQTTMA